MRKKVLSILTASFVLSALPVFATEEVNITSNTVTAVPISNSILENSVDVVVEGDMVLKGFLTNTFNEDGKEIVAVPLRFVNDLLGYTTHWNEDQTVEVTSNTRKSNMKIGMDSYFSATNVPGLVGMTAPVTLGYAPILIDGTTYVPVDFYNLFEMESAFVKYNEDGTVEINPNFNQEEDNTNIGVPNPITEFNNMDELNEKMAFEVKAPVIEENLNLIRISSIGDDLAELVYGTEDSNVTFRVSLGTEDNSGEYSDLDEEKMSINGIDVTVKGDTPELVIWTDNTYSYSLSAHNFELTNEIIENTVKSCIE